MDWIQDRLFDIKMESQEPCPVLECTKSRTRRYYESGNGSFVLGHSDNSMKHSFQEKKKRWWRR